MRGASDRGKVVTNAVITERERIRLPLPRRIAAYMRVGRRPAAMLEALISARPEQLRNLAAQDPVESSSLARSAEWLYLPARVRR